MNFVQIIEEYFKDRSIKYSVLAAPKAEHGLADFNFTLFDIINGRTCCRNGRLILDDEVIHIYGEDSDEHPHCLIANLLDPASFPKLDAYFDRLKSSIAGGTSPIEMPDTLHR